LTAQIAAILTQRFRAASAQPWSPFSFRGEDITLFATYAVSVQYLTAQIDFTCFVEAGHLDLVVVERLAIGFYATHGLDKHFADALAASVYRALAGFV